MRYHNLPHTVPAIQRGATSTATSSPFTPPAEAVRIVTIRAPSADAMGVLIRPEPLQRTCMELGVCQGDGRCIGCAPVEPAKPSTMQQFRHAIAIVALAGISVGIVFGALRWAADWVGS